MKVWLLGSGSGGNAVLVESEGSRVLIDAGFPIRTLARRLSAVGVSPASIEACLITHEHGDHVCGAATAAAKWGWQLYATAGTIAACPELAAAGAMAIRAGDALALSRVDIATIPIPHDAREPIGAVVTARSSGVRAGVCYDIGHASDAVRAACRELDVLVLEANHDEGMLRAGPYPPSVQGRIAGRNGHLSNRDAAALARDSVGRELNHVVMAHLSRQCNDHGIARRTVNAGLTQGGYRGHLTSALQHAAVGPFGPRSARAEGEVQYALF